MKRDDNKKKNVKGVFYSFDALIASIIILSGFFIILYFYSNQIPAEKIDHISEDILVSLSELKMKEINASGDIINASEMSNSVMEQIAEFWATGKRDLATELFNYAIKDLREEKIAILINKDPLLFNYSKPYQLISHKKILSGIDTNVTIRGYSARVYLSKNAIAPKKEYVYFGGYVGDGNITFKLFMGNYTKILSSYIEGSFGDGFDLYINNNFVSHINKTASGLASDKYYINYTNYNAGENSVQIKFYGNSSFIGGGFFRVEYESSEINYTPKTSERIYLPEIKGIVNLYDSFYIPGRLQDMTIHLEHQNNYPLFMSIGNTTIYESNSTKNITLMNSYLESLLDYNFLSNRTIPLRIGHQKGNITVLGIADVVLTTEYSKSMIENSDIPGFNGTRLDLAKILDKEFVDIVLEIAGNRIGLVGYHANVPPGQIVSLTDNKQVLYDEIDSYGPGSTPPICYACPIVKSREELLLNSNPNKVRAIILMSDGFANRCYSSPTSCGMEAAKQEAINEACNTYQNYGIRIFTIAFGNGADNQTLQQIASCGNGTFYVGSNATELEEIYEELAYYFKQSVAYVNQTAIIESVSSNLSNSYIDISYLPDASNIPYGFIRLDIETEAFGNNISEGSFAIPSGSYFIKGFATSYSSDLWTYLATINENIFFSLQSFGNDTFSLGDPFAVYIPASLVQPNNKIVIKTGISSAVSGSPDNKITYSIAIPSSSDFSDVMPFAEGCIWHIIFYDNTTIEIPIPNNATRYCSFSDNDYNQLDAYDVSAYQLFDILDSNDDGLIDIKFSSLSLSTETSHISKIPGMWGPLVVEVRAWQ